MIGKLKLMPLQLQKLQLMVKLMILKKRPLTLQLKQLLMLLWMYSRAKYLKLQETHQQPSHHTQRMPMATQLTHAPQ